MSHIHIPDGVLPAWLWALGWVAALALLALASRLARRAESRKAVPLVGAVSALVLVAMGSEIVPIAYHVNLTVIAGVLLGPWLGAISAFVVVLVLALLGHGGITVVGLNTLVIATEMALGWALVRVGVRALGRERVPLASGIATVLTLAVTTTLLVGIVALAGAAPGVTARETGALDPNTLEFRNPFSGGVFSVGLFGEGDHGAGAGEDQGASGPGDRTSGPGDAAGNATRGAASGGALDVGRFAAVVYTLGPIGWLIEALVTAGVLGYVARVRPTLVFGGALAEETRAPYGDEHGRH